MKPVCYDIPVVATLPSSLQFTAHALYLYYHALVSLWCLLALYVVLCTVMCSPHGSGETVFTSTEPHKGHGGHFLFLRYFCVTLAVTLTLSLISK